MADLEGDDNDNSFEGHDESDILFARSGDDSIFGADGGDAIFSGNGNDALDGDGGDDGDDGDDTLLNYALEDSNYDYFDSSGAESFWSLAEGTTIIHDFNVAEGAKQDDLINVEVVELDEYGPALLIHGENTETNLLPEAEDPLEIVDDILI